MAPGLAWANNGTDGGDLATAAAVGGIAHPTGYPTYLLLARLFQMLPFGELAYRTNLLSALCTILAAVFVYFIVSEYVMRQESAWGGVAGLAAGLSFGLMPLVWSQAVITEVYGLHSLFVAVALFLLTFPTARSYFQVFSGWMIGLALGNHMTSVFLIPLIFFSSLFVSAEKKINFSWPIFLRQSLGLCLGLLVYLVLPLRALSFPPVNWGNPRSLEGFLWLVMAQSYRETYLGTSLLSILVHLQTFTALLLAQVGIFGIFLGFLGLLFFFRPVRLYFNTAWIACASLVFSLVYGTADSYLYLVPVFLCFSIWIGVGLSGFLEMVTHIKYAQSLVVVLFTLSLFFGMLRTLPRVDASKDVSAEQFIQVVLNDAPNQALLFVRGDAAVFSLWYAHFALHQRPDVAIIATDMLHFPWYLESLRSAYPDLILTEPFPWSSTILAQNPDRPSCTVSYSGSTYLNCDATSPP